ncbi:MAG: hypothetical protein KatS3mg113_1063 [Planctomycetaceae bacterium]|nr:MAG: hypothetical protein KatS3mg113_1063 [Planctomycetaceae bacterium]
MLVLSRKRGERILINGTIVLTVLEVEGQRVRLGIDAPPEIPIRRGELEVSLSDVPGNKAEKVVELCDSR